MGWQTVLAAALVFASAFAGPAGYAAPADEARAKADAEFARRLNEDRVRLKRYDPHTHALNAVAARDFRHVVIGHGLGGTETPGIHCSASREHVRFMFFIDVIYGELEIKLRRELRVAAMKFNRSLISHPQYPDKDICFVTDKEDPPQAEVDSVAQDPARRPPVVDLHTAIRAADTDKVREFVAAGADVDASDGWSTTPVIWSLQRGNTAALGILLAAGADPDKAAGYTLPLTAAVYAGDAGATRMLLGVGRKGAKVKPPANWHPYGSAPLSVAARSGRQDLVRLLIEFAAVPSRGAEDWFEPLNWAGKNACVACAELMLASAGPEFVKSDAMRQLVHEELQGERTALLALFTHAALDVASYSRVHRDALAAARANTALKLLFAKGQDVNLLAPSDGASLTRAAAENDLPALGRLLEVATVRRSEIDQAVLAQDVAKTRALVPPGATLAQNLTTTPLMLAAKAGRAPIIETLISLGADVNARSIDVSVMPKTETALHFAFEALNVEAIETLLHHGADPEASTYAWPLLTDLARILTDAKATTAQKERLIALIITASPPTRRQVRTDLMLASASAWTPDDELVRMLIDRGGNSCGKVDYYHVAVVAALPRSSFATFKLLVDHCPDWTPTSPVARQAVAALFETPFYEESEAAERMKITRFLLLEQKVPMEPSNAAKYLCTSLRYGQFQTAELLLDADADINMVQDGEAALDCVWARFGEEKRAEEMRKSLKARGAKSAEEQGYKTVERPFPF